MGNALGKHKDSIDCGTTKRRGVDATEYDQSVVRRYICERRLMPFYDGAAEQTPVEGSGSSDSLASDEIMLIESTAKRKHKWKWIKRKDADPQAILVFIREIRTECPICFLTACCNQSICTSCFVSIRRPPSGRVISCPFCNRRDFSVTYKSPAVLLGLSPARLQPVKCESIRVYRQATGPSSAAYRNATVRSGYSTTQRYQPYSGAPFSVGSRSRATTYGGGVLMLYNERGEQYAYPNRYQNGYQRRPAYAYPGQQQVYSSAPYAPERSRYGSHVLGMF